jgi:hypothetical protein
MINKICIAALFWILILFHPILLAQNSKGLVLDSETKEPIPFVSITVLSDKEQYYIGNINGEFFIVDEILASDTVIFSSIGYESKNISVSEIRKNQMTVYLNPKIVNLQEVSILTPKAILQEAWDNIPNNYPVEYPLLKSKYRKQIAEDDRLIFLGECETLVNPFTLKENRKGKEPKLNFFDKKIFEDDSVYVSINYKLYPQLYPNSYIVDTENNNFSYTRVASNEDGIYKIEFSGGMNNFQDKGFIYISIDDKTILSIHHERKQADTEAKDKLGRKRGEMGDITFVSDYFWEETDSKYQLSYMRCVWTFYLAGNDKAKILKNTIHKYSAVVDYFITERGGKSSVKFKNSEDPFINTKDAVKLKVSDFTLIPADFSNE